MNPDTKIDFEKSEDSSRKKPLLIYGVSAIYLWSGFKGFLVGVGGPAMLWFLHNKEVVQILQKQPNYLEILKSTNRLAEITTDRFFFLTIGGIVQIAAAFHLFQFRKKGLIMVIAGLVINIISPITHTLLTKMPLTLGKGAAKFLVDWAISLLLVIYLWKLQKDGVLT